MANQTERMEKVTAMITYAGEVKRQSRASKFKKKSARLKKQTEKKKKPVTKKKEGLSLEFHLQSSEEMMEEAHEFECPLV